MYLVMNDEDWDEHIKNLLNFPCMSWEEFRKEKRLEFRDDCFSTYWLALFNANEKNETLEVVSVENNDVDICLKSFPATKRGYERAIKFCKKLNGSK